ncbi:MAG TPA: thioredoxin family protein [Thermodesulfovibrionales bacterium]|nr:thioredoxin family protein [Thermodesulfovibrionales bacterium]
MKKIYAFFVIWMVLFSANAFGSSAIHWFSLKEGTEKSKAEKKPMIVDFFYGKGCPRCEALQKGVYDNPTIAKKINDEFVPIRVDLTKKLTEEEEKLGNKYDFKNDCLLLFMDYQGNVMKDPSGKRLCFADTVEPEWFVQYLDMVKKQQK